jgi:hypothetical protein
MQIACVHVHMTRTGGATISPLRYQTLALSSLYDDLVCLGRHHLVQEHAHDDVVVRLAAGLAGRPHSICRPGTRARLV